MKVLVLRPERAAVRTARALEAMGLTPLLAPVLAIETLDPNIPEVAYDAVLATSANGLRKLKDRPEMARLRGVPLIAVGDRTAEAGREAGFAIVHVADGDGRALVAEAKRLFPVAARFLHAAGADRAYDVAGALGAAGHAVDVVELYRATPAKALPDTVSAALAAGEVGAVLHHSRRIAETFLTLAAEAGLTEVIRPPPHVALALRVAEPLHAAGCRTVAVAARPDEAALFDALAGVIAPGSQSGGERSN